MKGEIVLLLGPALVFVYFLLLKIRNLFPGSRRVIEWKVRRIAENFSVSYDRLCANSEKSFYVLHEMEASIAQQIGLTNDRVHLDDLRLRAQALQAIIRTAASEPISSANVAERRSKMLAVIQDWRASKSVEKSG